MDCKQEKHTRDEAVLGAIFNPFQPFPSTITVKPKRESARLPASLVEAQRKTIRLTEQNNYEQALAVLDEAITKHSSYAALFNDRAQLHRLMKNNDAAISDLNTAINLSDAKGRVAKHAFAQRGLLRKLKSLDDLALQDFQAAADLGCEFSRIYVAKHNPYAALCNEMLSKAFSQLTGEA